MCGFCGIYDPDGDTDVDRSLVTHMTRLMIERGPDAEGLYFAPHLGLGHRRLKVIDLEAGAQPVFNEDRSVLVVFNGEIFNFQQIRRELEDLGHVFSTNTDTEAIVHAYEEYGVDCVNHFRGMFAFGLYDTREREILLARDRMGIKPLYYAVSNGRLLFASEIKPLLLALGQTARPRAKAIDYFITSGFVPGELTMFEGIHKLLPGHILRWRNRAPEVTCYWDVPDRSPVSISLEDAEEEFADLLRESVSLRMVSDVPVGAFLSGGVDSSLVVAQMSELTDRPVKTFSIGYHESPEDNELPFARDVAKLLGTEHTEYHLSSGDFFDNVESFVLRCEEPIVEAAGIALFKLAQRARQDVTVVLAGEGGDEILSGYPIYRTMTALGRTQRLRQASGIAWAARRLAGLGGSEKQRKYLDWLGGDLRSSYRSVPHDVTGSIRGDVFDKGFSAAVDTAVEDEFRQLFDHLADVTDLGRMAYIDFKSWLPDDLLIKADKMTMAASVEMRLPLLDHKLVEFCMSLPDGMRLRGTTGKYLLKRSAERWLPKRIIYRKKQGFPTPIAQWFRGVLYEPVREMLLDRRTLERGYFRPEYVESVLRRHRAGTENMSRRILALVILEVWHRTFVDSPCEPVARASRDWLASTGVVVA